ncbi:prolyl oligopeptidase family serine peptidase [Aeromonas enteropelogenes]|uniref:Peptidase S9 n=1 Tax=Aeromonas enteropelogenes TaxID=29489 RepID=A0A175VDP3_AEREN|nr:prolyl oligopeptidase family serine peptidase [Aeromonas enteropelogenes]KXU78814.1 peptidase S9 [Aeromonas enteropelogenes]
MRLDILVATLLATPWSWAQFPLSPPPIASQPHLIAGAPARHDSYFWLRDESRSDPAILALLQEQNRWSEQQLASQQPLEARLRGEFARHPKGEPAPDNWLIRGELAWQVRADGSLWQRQQGESRQLLPPRADEGYYAVGGWALSPDNRLLAIAEDRCGDLDYRITLIALHGGDTLTTLSHRSADLAWSQDGQTLYTIANEHGTLRPWQLLSWRAGREQTLYEEADPAWLLSLYLTTDGQHLLLQGNNHDSSEQYLLDSGQPELILPRRRGVEYYLDSQSGWVIKSNRDGAFALYGAAAPESEWQRLWPVPGEDLGNPEKWRLFDRHLVVQFRQQGEEWLALLDRSGRERQRLPLAMGAGTGWLQGEHDPASDRILVRTQGLSQPPGQRWLDLTSGRWQDHDDPSRASSLPYHSERRWVRSADGTRVPVSLVWRADVATRAVLLYGYGAYGTPMRPYYQKELLSLLDRGFVYAIAHVRGGGMLGDQWTRDGRGINKQNGISDFIAVGQALRHWSSDASTLPLFAMGGSAGGTLVAAALNQQPTLFSGAVLQVPFVDLLGTMSDPALPLTRQEYREWGNPARAVEYQAMRRVSPYDNLHRAPYPPLLITTALHDSQVPYWEPVKWLARLREHSTRSGPYLLLTEFEGGHGAGGGDRAREFAFLLHLAGITR